MNITAATRDYPGGVEMDEGDHEEVSSLVKVCEEAYLSNMYENREDAIKSLGWYADDPAATMADCLGLVRELSEEVACLTAEQRIELFRHRLDKLLRPIAAFRAEAEDKPGIVRDYVRSFSAQAA